MVPSVPSALIDNQRQHTSVYKVLSGNVSMGQPSQWDGNNIPTVYTQDNMTGNMFRHVFSAANTSEIIEHDLGRVPVGYIVTRKSVAVDIYDGTLTDWTISDISLKATVSGADVTIYIF